MTQETVNTTPDDKKRTIAQNNALHLWFEQLAKELNENGVTMQAVLNKFVLEVPATKYGIKEFIWRPLQENLLGKKSTTELLKQQEIDLLWDSLNKFFGEMGIQVPPFPSYQIKDY